jgi:aspartate racemase
MSEVRPMKTIGLIGGMSWESSAEYYRIINQTVQEKLGGLHSARCLLYSFDFQEIEQLQHRGEWERLTELMIRAAQRLEGAGAQLLIICTNTMHKMAEDVQDSVDIPLVHIADATAKAIIEKGLNGVALLGTRFTMEEDFYKKRLREKFGLNVIIPPEREREVVDKVIYNELCCGIMHQSSKEQFKAIIKGLASNGAQGVILGCTEIPLLISQQDVEIQLFDTTKIHAQAAIEMALR